MKSISYFKKIANGFKHIAIVETLYLLK